MAHAGLYYTPGSLKARLCRRGVELMRAYCAEQQIPYEQCGKVLVATTQREEARLGELLERAQANGVPGVEVVDGDGLRALEPHVAGRAALHSPTTAIVDFAAVARRFADEIVQRGGELRFGSPVASIGGGSVRMVDGEVERADRVLVCAGLATDRLATASGRSPDPRIVPFRGEYYALQDHARDLVRGLVYPVPDPGLPFLGVHLTRTVHGEVLVGPGAVLGMRDLAAAARWPGMRAVARRHWRVALAEGARSRSRRLFVRAAQRYVPELRARDVVPAPAGIRAQAVSAAGELVDDFVLDQADGVVWVRNAPSPAATSSMAIAEELVSRL